MIGIDTDFTWLIVLGALWVLPWKGWALWLAARRKEKWWFIALLVLNTLAILEIIYIFAVAKRSDKQQQDAPMVGDTTHEHDDH